MVVWPLAVVGSCSIRINQQFKFLLANWFIIFIPGSKGEARGVVYRGSDCAPGAADGPRRRHYFWRQRRRHGQDQSSRESQRHRHTLSCQNGRRTIQGNEAIRNCLNRKYLLCIIIHAVHLLCIDF